MNFLAPLFFLGAVGVLAPIVFHLIRRSTREKVIFSSLMFLQPVAPRVTKRSRLENIMLLLLRCSVLILLAFAFTRPYFRRPVAALVQPVRGIKTLCLLDVSASMQRSDLWAKALGILKQKVERAEAGDPFAVYVFDRSLRALVTFEEWQGWPPEERKQLLMQRLAGVKPAWASTQLGGALMGAAEVMEDAHREAWSGKREIVLISDLQEGANTDGLQGYAWPKNLEVTLEKVQPGTAGNAGIQIVNEREQGLAPNQLRIRIANAGDSKKEQFSVAVEPGAGRPSSKMEVYVPAGQNRIVTLPLSNSVTSARIALSGDEESFDNNAFYVVPEKRTVTIAYRGSEKETDTAAPLYFLKRAFGASSVQETLILQITNETSEAVARQANFLVVTEGSGAAPLARQFLEEGKGVLWVVEKEGETSDLGTILGSEVRAEEAPPAEYALFGQINFQHPLFAPFSDPRFSDFSKIHFWKHRRMNFGPSTNNEVLARFDTGDPALLHYARGRGSLFILAAGWRPAESQLALSSKFVPLLGSMIELSLGGETGRRQFTVGEEIDLAAMGVSLPAMIQLPGGTTTNAGQARWVGEVPGFYSINQGNRTILFGVNLSANESRTAALGRDVFEELSVPLKREGKVTPAETIRRQQQLLGAELENRQKLWRWLILGALLVLVVETWLAGLVTNRVSPSPERSV